MNKLNPDSSQHKFNGGYFDKMYMINLLHEKYREDQIFVDNNPKLIDGEIIKEIELTQEIEQSYINPVIVDLSTSEETKVNTEFENIYPNNETFEVDKSTIQLNKVMNESVMSDTLLKKKIDNIIKLKRW